MANPLTFKTLKAAIIEPVGGHGGMNYYDLNIARALVENGMDVTLYTCDKTQLPKYLSFSIKRNFKGIWGGAPKYYRAFRYILGLFNSFMDAKLKKIRVLHFHFFHYTWLEKISISMARVAGFKTVITVHDVESFIGLKDTKFINEILLRADKLISHNIISQKQILQKTSVAFDKISVIPHGNYLSDIPYKINSISARKKLDLPVEGFILLFFGQIKKVKGLDILLNALPDVIKKYPKTYLVIAGKVWKDTFSQYETIIQDNKLTENIMAHIRYIPDDQVPLYYNAANTIVLPYRRIYQSGVLLMAMSYKKPVIASNLDGMSEIVEHGKNGLLFKSENPKSLSDEIIHAIENPDLLNAIACSGLETVLHCHDWDLIGKKTADLYQNVSK